MNSVKLSAASAAETVAKKAEIIDNRLEPALYEDAIRLGEAVLTSEGALTARTGVHTGRSAQDKFIVRDEHTDPVVWWEGNRAMAPEKFDALFDDFLSHMSGRKLYAQDLFGGADPHHRVRVRVFSELAWHSLFIRNLLIRPDAAELRDFVPELTIINLPGFEANPSRHGCRSKTVIACDLSRGIILIGGTSYAGETKKSVFTYLNHVLPAKGVMPMHCSANMGTVGDTAVFFGLSGTGKTTLSADPNRILIGDDEHGWGENGVFNFEGGCYAKTVKLSAEAEPQIWAASQRFGTVLENVVIDPETRVADFNDESLTENTRAAYPLHFIANASKTGRGGHPKTIIMLTADAFGVMPPIAKLTPAQAMYHFLAGYTAKVAGTEKGVTEPQATFSTAFGGPFLTRRPAVYGNLLREMIATHGATCWLVNTGWTGGIYGVGRRMPIKVTRTLLTAALDGSLNDAKFYTDRNFGFQVPTDVPGVEPHILYPRKTWADKSGFDQTAAKLVAMFTKEFEQYEKDVDAEIMDAAPRVAGIAAE